MYFCSVFGVYENNAKMNKTIVIAGKDYPLESLDNSVLRHVWVEVRTAFLFYSGSFKDLDFILLEQKSKQRFTPRKLKMTAERLTTILDKPIVFLFESLPYFERNRLIEQDVYFVVSGKYAFLPNLLIAARETEPVKGEKLTAVAQWLLLAHLQGLDLNHKTLKEVEQVSPYQYVTLTRAFRLLEGLKLCSIETDEARFKHVVFSCDKRTLYEQAGEYVISPVKQRLYCDKVGQPQQYKRAGISALSHYSALNPDETTNFALTAEQWRNRDVGDFVNVNPIEGDFCVEIWQYPPIPTDEEYVDKLSLALSLQDDHDPRVEKEVELIIEKMLKS